MLRKTEFVILSILLCFAFASAARLQSLKIVPDSSAAGVRTLSDTIRVEWVQLSGVGSLTAPEPEPLTGDVYYATVPAAGDLSKYTKLTSVVDANVSANFSVMVKKRATRFIPNRQGGRMGAGVYYIIVASVTDGGDTLYSDYMNLMAASDAPPAIGYPKADVMKGDSVRKVTERAPIFSWNPVPGVPYYHIIVSDAPLFDTKGKANEDANIIWQAITPNTRIAYGAADPSKTTTVAPPPLSPGAAYSWMVFNNYGNYPAFTTWKVRNDMDVVAGRFLVVDEGGSALTAPAAVSPARGQEFNGSVQIDLRWNKLDNKANSYLVNLFKEGKAEEFGMGAMGDFSVNVLVWETTVPRGNGSELSVRIDAAKTLTGGSYKWRVYAIDARGAAYTASTSVSSFAYANKSSEGAISVRTVETIGGVDLPVGYVELRPEVLSGPAMTPFLLYTNGAGVLDRSFSAGTYRFTAVKDGYPAYTSTVTVAAGSRPTSIKIPMVRSEAVLYGKVLAVSDGSALNAANVIAVSDWGDTVSTTTDGSGNFVLACRAVDWTLTAEKPGFMASAPKRVTLGLGDNKDFGSVSLVRNPIALYGTVRNSSGEPLVAARVRLFREGVLVDELASTPQNGAYVFYVNSGVYTITAEKSGFAMFSRSVAVTGTTTQDISLKGRAALVSGVITGMTWVDGVGNYVSAPVTSALIAFADTAGSDVFTVTSDPVFGKFSVNLPLDRDYKVTSSAAGFTADTAGFFSTMGASDGSSKTYAATLYALAAIKGSVVGVPGGVPVDVIVSGAEGRVVASVKSVGGTYEVRNIPDGSFTVTAGAAGYFTNDVRPITVASGRPTAGEGYDFTMETGNTTIRFKVDGIEIGEAVRVISPISLTVPFNGGEAVLDGAGGVDYTVEAVPADSNRLELGYHKFKPADTASSHTETLRFPFTYAVSGGVKLNAAGKVAVPWPQNAGNLYSPIRKVVLYYRSEGSVRFDSLSKTPGVVEPFSVPARDGCDLEHYFRVYLENGDIYGSSKRLYRMYVNPDTKSISKAVVEPGASGGDTLVLPSSYKAEFAFKAFYGDQFVPINGIDIGAVVWSISDSEGKIAAQGATGSTGAFPYQTPSVGQNLTLKAAFTPSGGYSMRKGADSVVIFPIRVTGKALKSMTVSRKGDAGPILSTETADFRAEAFDADGKPVTVSPRWRVFPDCAAGRSMESDGIFIPNGKFVGMARIEAVAGGLTGEYSEPGSATPGQRVEYPLRRNANGNDTAYTCKGMRVILPRGVVREGTNEKMADSAMRLTNAVQIGTENYRMADSLAFRLSFSNSGVIDGDVILAFDIPENFRGLNKGGYEFRVARWFPDSSLRWIPLPTDEAASVPGRVVAARLSREAPADDTTALSKGRRKIAARQIARESMLIDSARYALVVKAGATTFTMSVSPHPFSPYIVPKKEYPNNDKAGTCVKVNVQAPEPYVKSVKVRILNTTGKMVWGIERLSAPIGENAFWWNGRTSGNGGAVSEEVWSEDYYERNAGRPMCRNGRYYVMVIVTDKEGKQKRAVKPLVLMK